MIYFKYILYVLTILSAVPNVLLLVGEGRYVPKTFLVFLTMLALGTLVSAVGGLVRVDSRVFLVASVIFLVLNISLAWYSLNSVAESINRKAVFNDANAELSIEIVDGNPIAHLRIEGVKDETVLDVRALPYGESGVANDVFSILISPDEKIPMSADPKGSSSDSDKKITLKKGEVLTYEIDLLENYKNLYLVKDGAYRVKYSARLSNGSHFTSNSILLEKKGDEFLAKSDNI